MRLGTTGGQIGPYLIMTKGESHESPGPSETTTLYVIKRDFRDIRLARPWPRWMWPWRRWWIDAHRRRLALWIAPRLMRVDLEIHETMMRDEDFVRLYEEKTRVVA